MIADISKVVGGEHYLALMLVLLFSVILMNRNILSERVHQGSFWITLLVCVLLVGQNIAESVAALNPTRRSIRMIASIAGYMLRPAAVLGCLLVIWPAGKPKWFLWIPVAVNALLYCTALFMPLVFSIDEDYVFREGPLHAAAFVISIFYLIMTLIMIHLRFRDRRTGELFMVYLSALGCLGAIGVDMLFGGVAIISAILISSLIFYLFLRAQDLDRDPLTRLWNRRTFYEDCQKFRNTITAVASVDMNGLKKINDDLGHEAGDRALKTLSRSFMSIMGKNALCYRTGGDEFMILFLHCSEDDIKQILTAFLDDIWQSGLSVSIGLATGTECGNSLEQMIRISDQRMYEDKSQYYQAHDRRRHR